jgi:hypothetical protein
LTSSIWNNPVFEKSGFATGEIQVPHADEAIVEPERADAIVTLMEPVAPP